MQDKDSTYQTPRNIKKNPKELGCIYQIELLLDSYQLSLQEIFEGIIRIIPSGMEPPEDYKVKIVFEDSTFQSPDFNDLLCCNRADIRRQDDIIGVIEISYVGKNIERNDSYARDKNQKLLDTIADRIGKANLHQRPKHMLPSQGMPEHKQVTADGKEWTVIVDLIRRTDQKTFIRMSRKMMYHLIFKGIREAKMILEESVLGLKNHKKNGQGESNYPSLKLSLEEILRLCEQVYTIADRYLSDNEITAWIQKWIKEDRMTWLVKAIDNVYAPWTEIIDVIKRYREAESQGESLALPIEKWVRVSLLRRFFTDNTEFVKIAKRFVKISDFYELAPRIVFPHGSCGKLGGKSAGLFLAQKILNKSEEYTKFFGNVRVPKTWYVTADTSIHFLHYNDLEFVNEQKYKELDQVRIEYPNIIQLFKYSQFSSEIVKGLSMALDDFGDNPLIVRSSSLLEDRTGTAFSGKYKSLFLANQGSKAERLNALTDAIAEIYASVVGPDPIGYRAERELLDFNEEMGIMIQEVVGIKAGHYYFPVFAGVAFSQNEFLWSPRIKREDGLIRLVPGMGTRAVDRLADECPVMISPGYPSLRVNVTPEEIRRYSPKKVDLINLETGSFETIEISELLKECGNDIPNIDYIVSACDEDYISNSSIVCTDFYAGDHVVTFERLIKQTSFVKQVKGILKVLQEQMGRPVEIEFASDGRDFYLLQCRPQSCRTNDIKIQLPQDIPSDRIIFSANRYISTSRIQDVAYVVYVDPKAYGQLATREDLLNVGRCVGMLNLLLPKRNFLLMGPGRWGSRGDIKLGVQVTYSDISNTTILAEIARKSGSYTPELSFGTHFFQDLVESEIAYLPLYPDDAGIIFNEIFLTGASNALSQILPEFTHAVNVVRVINIPESTGGLLLRVVMSADADQAIGFLHEP